MEFDRCKNYTQTELKCSVMIGEWQGGIVWRMSDSYHTQGEIWRYSVGGRDVGTPNKREISKDHTLPHKGENEGK